MNTLEEVQEAFSSEYGIKYPLADEVKSCLEALLSNTFAGYWEKFERIFVQQTLKLLKLLKIKGFPLVVEGQVVVHLTAPVRSLESGEMFFQVGHTTPGTLALKFTKYSRGTVVVQPSTVAEKDYHIAFTPSYFEELRNESTELGDQLMRVLIVSVPIIYNETVCNKLEKVEAKRIIMVFQQGTTGKTEDKDVTTVEDNPSYPSVHDAIKDKSEDRQSSDALQKYICKSEAVTNSDIEYKERRLIEETQGAPITNGTQGTQDNPQYPSVENAVKSCQNPSYPDVCEAVRISDSFSSVTTKEPLIKSAAEMSGDERQERHIRKDKTDKVGDRSGQTVTQQSHAACDINHSYPDIVSACESLENKNVQSTNRVIQKGKTSNSDNHSLPSKKSVYPMMQNAVSANPHSTVSVEENPGYPLVRDAVKDKSDDGQSSEALQKYVCEIEAVRNSDRKTQGTPFINDTQGTQDNPQYPSVENAVKSCPNPSYPDVCEAVKSIPEGFKDVWDDTY